MEPKVIKDTYTYALQSKPKWAYDPKQNFSLQSGSGNNWAMGYARHGPATHKNILKLVRKEVEACDTFNGALLLQSLAGGTGSGVGAFVTEALYDRYPKCFILNQVSLFCLLGWVVVFFFVAFLFCYSFFINFTNLV